MKTVEIKEGEIYEGCNGTQKLVESIVNGVVNWQVLTAPAHRCKPSKPTGSSPLKTFAGWCYQKVDRTKE